MNETIQRTRLLLLMEEERPTAAVTTGPLSDAELRMHKQIDDLTEQVAVLRQRQESSHPVTRYLCNQLVHVKRNCPVNRQREFRKCFSCGHTGHIAKDYFQGNYRGVSAQGQGSGHSSQQ